MMMMRSRFCKAVETQAFHEQILWVLNGTWSCTMQDMDNK